MYTQHHHPPRALLLDTSDTASNSWYSPPSPQLPLALVVVHQLSTSNSSDPPVPSYDEIATGPFNPSMAIILVVLLSAFFFMGLFSVYVRRFTFNNALNPNNLTQASLPEGLDREFVQNLPLVPYSAVKTSRVSKASATECAVCLAEFEDDEALRVLPKCKHCFHPDCIDMWLYSHTTCPLCRRSLLPSFRWGSKRGSRHSESFGRHPTTITDFAEDIQAAPSDDPQVVNTTRSDEGAASNLSTDDRINNSTSRRYNRSPSLAVKVSTSSPFKSKASFRRELKRSHSTGHSLVKPRALNRADSVVPRSSGSPEQPISNCLPLTPPLFAGLHRSKSQMMLSNREEEISGDPDHLFARRRDIWSSSRRWSSSLKRAFSFGRSPQEAVANAMGEGSSSSGRRPFERLPV